MQKESPGKKSNKHEKDPPGKLPLFSPNLASALPL